MAIDLKAWLKDMGVKDDQIEGIVPVLAPAAENIEKSTLRLSDYSREMDKVRKLEKDLATANDRLNQEMVEWATTQAEGGKITEKMRADLAAAQGEVTRLTAVVTSKAGELGLDATAILASAAPAVTPPPAPGVDADKFLTREDYARGQGEFADYFMTLPAELAAISDDHFALTGERLDGRALINEVKTRARDRSNRNTDGTLKKPVDLRAIWEEQHQIADKRAARAQADLDKQLKDAEDRGFQRARTESALPGEPSPGRHAPVFRKSGETREHLQQHAQRPSNAVRADRITSAASALSSGRYRDTGAGGHSPA